MEENKCPRCDHEGLDAFSRGKRLYRLLPGDVMVCRWCGAVLIYEEGGSREPMKEEFKRMRSDPETWRKVVRTMIDALRYLGKDL